MVAPFPLPALCKTTATNCQISARLPGASCLIEKEYVARPGLPSVVAGFGSHKWPLRKEARCALRSRASSPAPSINADFAAPQELHPHQIHAGRADDAAVMADQPLRSRTGSSSQE